MQINIKKRHLAIFISVIILLGVIGYGIAVTGVSHSVDELPDIPWDKITGAPADQDTNAQTICANSKYLRGDGSCVTPAQVVSAGGGGGGVEPVWFGNVGTHIIDGTQIPEISCPPYGGVSSIKTYGQARVSGGNVQVRARAEWSTQGSCDTGWITGTSTSCVVSNRPLLKSTVTATPDGVSVNGDYYGNLCSNSAPW